MFEQGIKQQLSQNISQKHLQEESETEELQKRKSILKKRKSFIPKFPQNYFLDKRKSSGFISISNADKEKNEEI